MNAQRLFHTNVGTGRHRAAANVFADVPRYEVWLLVRVSPCRGMVDCQELWAAIPPTMHGLIAGTHVPFVQHHRLYSHLVAQARPSVDLSKWIPGLGAAESLLRHRCFLSILFLHVLPEKEQDSVVGEV